MASDLQHEGLDFCKTVFETVRQMSAEGRGVTRQGYGPVECKVVEYLKSVGRDLNLRFATMRPVTFGCACPESILRFRHLSPVVTPTRFPKAETTTDWPV